MQNQGQPLPPGLRVLLVEDEPLIAMDGESALKTLGVDTVVSVRSVAEGLSALEGGRFDAAILDLQLGTETAWPLAQRLDELGVPFGFLTGYQGDAIPDDYKGRPVVAKPFTAQHMQEMLFQLIDP